MGDTKKIETAEKLRARLERARERTELVRVRRDIRRAERITGYVVALGEGWVLLAPLEGGILLDGYTALRLADVESIKRDKDGEDFVRRALDLAGHWPPRAPEGVMLDDDPSLVASAARAAGLIALYEERSDPEVCHIGKPQDWNKRSVSLLEVDTDANWQEDGTKFKFADLSRIDFGGRYERVLERLAGPAPAREIEPAGVPEPL